MASRRYPPSVDELRQQGIEHILVLPLYPQFSATTTGAIYDQVAALYRAARDVPSIAIVKHYHRQDLYIEALAQSVRAHWAEHGRAERLLLSFHGIPQRNVDRGDPYLQHCQATAQQLAARLQLDVDQYQVSFQSRFGARAMAAALYQCHFGAVGQCKIGIGRRHLPSFCS